MTVPLDQSDMEGSETYLAAFGANRGDPVRMFDAVASELAGKPGFSHVIASPLYCTRPVGSVDDAGEPGYGNGALRFSATHDAWTVFSELQELERSHGRASKGDWAPRTVDLDLLLAGPKLLTSDALTTPHVRMHYRRFVLAPAADIASELRHPILQMTCGELNRWAEQMSTKSAVGETRRYLLMAPANEWELQAEVLSQALSVQGMAASIEPLSNDEITSVAALGRTVVGVGLTTNKDDVRPTVIFWHGPAPPNHESVESKEGILGPLTPTVDLRGDPLNECRNFIQSLAVPSRWGVDQGHPLSHRVEESP